MALTIRSLPVLENAAANRFVKKACKALKENKKLDLSQQIKSATFILKSAKL